MEWGEAYRWRRGKQGWGEQGGRGGGRMSVPENLSESSASIFTFLLLPTQDKLLGISRDEIDTELSALGRFLLYR